jgi:hypothetical protein
MGAIAMNQTTVGACWWAMKFVLKHFLHEVE